MQAEQFDPQLLDYSNREVRLPVKPDVEPQI